MIFIATLSWFYALSNVSAVNCIAISCMTPIFILILAKTSLNEILNKEVIFLAIVAFIGALIVIRPDPYSFNSISFFAVLTAFLWALNSTFTKKHLSPKISSISIFFVTAILLSLIALPYVLIKPHTITLEQIIYLTAVTIVFDTANIILIWVFSRGKISLVAPFDFLRVVFTTILSSIMLDDTISSNAILGIVIILIGNTLAVVYQRKSSKMISYESKQIINPS
jgi:S-adenosylmethionine uptake transporter